MLDPRIFGLRTAAISLQCAQLIYCKFEILLVSLVLLVLLTTIMLSLQLNLTLVNVLALELSYSYPNNICSTLSNK